MTQEKMKVRLIDGRRTLKSLLLRWGRDSVKEQWGEACLFRAEGGIRQNSPTVQFHVNGFRPHLSSTAWHYPHHKNQPKLFVI